MKQIKRLTLDGELITAESLPHLLPLQELEWLYMRDTGVDKLSGASKQFVQVLPNCAIALPPTEREKEWSGHFTHPRIAGD